MAFQGTGNTGLRGIIPAILVALFTTPAVATEPAVDRQYASGMEGSRWTMEAHGGACHLIHTIPRFGVAVFSRTGPGEQALRLYTRRPPGEIRPVDIYSVPNPWQGGAVRTIGETVARPGPETFRIGHTRTNHLLQELERGRKALLVFEDWHTGAETVGVALTTPRFRTAYRDYLACAGELPSGTNGHGETARQVDPLDDAPEIGTFTTRRGEQQERPGAAIRPVAATPPAPGSELLERFGHREATPPPPPTDTDGNGDGAEGDAVPDRVHFVFDDTGLTFTERERLRAFLEAAPEDAALRITGHTDTRGDPEYNEALGLARAREVRDYLVDHGADEERIELTTRGEGEPATRDTDPDAHAENRRVTLEVVDT